MSKGTDLIIKKLKELRALGMTQQALAYKLEVSLPTINSWEHAKAEPRESHKAKIIALHDLTFGINTVDDEVLEANKKKVLELQDVNLLKDIQNSQEVLDALTLKMTYHTNTIEGNTMTEGDTADVLFNNKVLSDHTLVEQLEVTNHKKAFMLALRMADGRSITVQDIFALHKELMVGILPNAGMMRTHSVRILGSGVPLANHIKLDELMRSFVKKYNKAVSSDAIVAHIADMHAQFEQMHPFSDGNGRVGRLLMNITALKYGLLPVLVVKDRKYAYYKYLKIVQLGGDIKPLENFIYEAMLESAKILRVASE